MQRGIWTIGIALCFASASAVTGATDEPAFSSGAAVSPARSAVRTPPPPGALWQVRPAETRKTVPFESAVDEETLEFLRQNPPATLESPKPVSDQEDPASGGLLALSAAPVTTASFQGVTSTGWIPPDNGFAVGPDHVLEAVNAHWRAFTKEGMAATPRIPFCGSGGWWELLLPADVNCFDPKVIYDQHSGRWILLALATKHATNEAWYLLSTSWTSNPLGHWCNFIMDSRMDGPNPTSNWADYPGLGVDDQAIYITTNQFLFGGGFQYSKIRVLGKSQLYANTCGLGSNLAVWDFWDLREPNGATAFTLQPAHTYGTPGAEYLVSSGFSSASSVTLWTLSDPLATPPSLTRTSVPTQIYHLPPMAEQCRNAALIHTGDSRLLNAVYRNGRVVTAHASACISDLSKSCLHLLEISPSGPSPTAIFDSFYGAWSTGWSYYYPAIMPDQTGNLYVVFNRSRANPDNTDGCVELRHTGKLVSGTQLEASDQVRPGADRYEGLDGIGRNRWGDYSGIAADPQDPSAVWMSGEFVSGPDIWSTWIARTGFCHALTRTHTGSGGDPVAAPAASAGCSAGHYRAGEAISLTAAPADGWTVESWSGTVNDASAALTNSLVMPGGPHTVSVSYREEVPDIELVNGVARADSINGTSIQGSWNYYWVDLPAGRDELQVDLFDLSGDADLYVRFEEKPTLDLWSCRPFLEGTASETCSFLAPAAGRWWIGVNNFDTGIITYQLQASWSASPSDTDFHTFTPCRVFDSRSGAPLASLVTRIIPIAGACGVPATADAVAVHVTVVTPSGPGYLLLWPADQAKPLISTINFSTGQVRSNNAIVPLASDGSGSFAAEALVGGGGTVHVVIDISGYFD